MEPNILKIERGTVLDERFEVMGVLGRGGFATVYEARQLNMDRPVALKVLGLRPGQDDKDLARFGERFFLEAQRAANIPHPGIVTIYDYGVTAGGIPYISMELLSGQTFDTVLAESGPLSVERALPLFVRCLDALSAAHEQGIVHKDLKPSNLFLTHPGSIVEDVRILDFGIAAMSGADLDDRLTGSNQFIGTAAYCSPEYYLNQAVSPRVDVYQMGLVLAEAITGRRVVDAPNALQAIEIHCTSTLQLPWALLESPLGEVFRRALSSDPKARYPSAAEMRDALAAIAPDFVLTLTDDDLHRRTLIFPNPTPRLQSKPLDDADAVLLRLGAGDTLTAGGKLPNFSSLPEQTLDAPNEPETEPDLFKSAEPSPASPPRRPRLIGVGVVALVVLGTVAVFVGFSIGDGTPPEHSEPAAKAPPAAFKTSEVRAAEPEETPERAEPAPPAEKKIPENAAPPIKVELVLDPKDALVEPLSEQTPRPISKNGRTALRTVTGRSAMPWDVRVSSPRHKDSLVRLEPAANGGDALYIRYGQTAGDKQIWGNPKVLEADVAGHFTLKVALPRTGKPTGQKAGFKKKWIIK